MDSATAYLDLYDYRLRVARLYRARNDALRNGEDPELVWHRFRAERNRIFREHAQSALDDDARRGFRGLRYFPYNPDACVEAVIDPDVEPQRLVVEVGNDAPVPMHRVAALRFVVGGRPARLSLYWIDVYGGGLFLPFRDTTAPAETYGGGRYLFDTIKGSDFVRRPGADGLPRIELDFNYAYNPSCAYSSRWVCPLAPPENRLPFPIPAGEKTFSHAGKP